MPNYYTTPSVLKPELYRAWLEHLRGARHQSVACTFGYADGMLATCQAKQANSARAYPNMPRRQRQCLFVVSAYAIADTRRVPRHIRPALTTSKPMALAALWLATSRYATSLMALGALVSTRLICGLTTDAGNKRDRLRDGNYARGEAHARAKLTDAQVAAIRAEARRRRINQGAGA